MAVTEEEIQQKQKRLAKLREQTAEARVRRTENEQTVSRELTNAQLDSEIAEHEAILERERENAKLTNIRAGSKSNLDHAKNLMAAASAAEVAPPPPPSDDDNGAKEPESKSDTTTVKVKSGEEK